MKPSELLGVRRILFNHVRRWIMAPVSLTKGAVDFNSLIEALDLTKGNLSTHIKKLEDERLVKVDKTFVGRKPQTTYRCTSKGKKAIKTYLSTIEAVLKN